jgi:hypothetical protein
VGLYQAKKLQHSKEMMKRTIYRMGKVFANQASDKGLLSKIHKELN